MCSSCGQKARGLPGATSRNPIVLGDPNGQPSQPATFNIKHPNADVGQYKYVSGDGIQAAVENGDISIGYQQAPARPARVVPSNADAPDWYVRVGNNRWVGFKTRAAAERYAKTVNGTVATRDQVLRVEG